jgi:hypothetical protein
MEVWIFFTSKCHGCKEAPANKDSCNTSGWQKLPSTSGKLTSGEAPDAAGAYTSQYARKINARTDKCAMSPFLGSLRISRTTTTVECLTAGCKAFSLANVKRMGTKIG